MSRFIGIIRKVSSNVFHSIGIAYLKETKRRIPFVKYIGLSLLPLTTATSLNEQRDFDVQRILMTADQFYHEHSYKKLYDYLIVFKDTENAEMLWRLCRVMYEMSKLSSSPAEQKELVFEAFNCIDRALKLDPENFAVHKWMFILLDKKSSYDGLKERISKSFIVKKHIERACELNPRDGTSLYLLGYWCFAVTELPWYQRKIASTLFATPPTSSYEEALQYFLQAESVEPNFYSMNLLMIGKTYLRLNDKNQALLYLSKARDYQASSSEDLQAKEEAAQLLKTFA